MVNKILDKFNITNYSYFPRDNILIIYEPIRVKDFVKIRKLLKNYCELENVIIRSR